MKSEQTTLCEKGTGDTAAWGFLPRSGGCALAGNEIDQKVGDRMRKWAGSDNDVMVREWLHVVCLVLSTISSCELSFNGDRYG